MILIDADLAIEKCNEDLDAVKDLPQRQDGILDAIMNIHECPTIDAVPRQKYEEDMENAFAHGYTDAESNFRKMIADGELIEVVRCKDCKYKNVYRFPPKYDERDYCEKHEKTVDVADFCSWGERRTDEQT